MQSLFSCTWGGAKPVARVHLHEKLKMSAFVILVVLATTPAIQGAVQLDSLMIFVTAHDSTVK